MSNEGLRPEAGEPSSPESNENLNSQASEPRPKSGGRAGWIIALVVGIVVGALVIGFASRGFTGPNQDSKSDPMQTPDPTPTEVVCPKPSTTLRSPAPLASDGRVHGGKLSYPRLGEPWSPPHPDPRVPYGRNVSAQEVMTEVNYQPGGRWAASIRIGQVVSDGELFSPQQGAEILTKCILGVFYGDAKVTRDDQISKATKVDGKDAWLLRTHLSFDIGGLKAKGEQFVLVFVATGPDEASLYYASIPDNAPPELLKAAESLIGELKVDP